MTAQDHYNHANDLFNRAKICADKETRHKMVMLARQHLDYYHELLKQGATD